MKDCIEILNQGEKRLKEDFDLRKIIDQQRQFRFELDVMKELWKDKLKATPPRERPE